MGIVAKCPISNCQNDPTEGEGVYQFLRPNISFCLHALRLLIKNLPAKFMVCARVSKKQEMAENLVFGAIPLVLGVPNFPKLV